ncbi:TetR/AcrR family transcriptional regulator [Parasphingorhabdus pacifica]
MPRRVDHDRRRADIIDGVLRVVAREGLHAVTMRAVATEAGVSVRLVQYYFHTKARLMHAALRYLEERSDRRWNARLDQLDDPPAARAYLETFLAEALPTDEASRTFHLVWTSYAVLAMTDAELAEHPFVEGPDHFEREIAAVLRRAQEAGDLDGDRDVAIEAARMTTLNHGLGTSVLIGQRTPAEAMEVLGYHLDRLFVDGPSSRSHAPEPPPELLAERPRVGDESAGSSTGSP